MGACPKNCVRMIYKGEASATSELLRFANTWGGGCWGLERESRKWWFGRKGLLDVGNRLCVSMKK